MTSLHALLAYAFWTVLLVLGVCGWRAAAVLGGRTKANEFTSGEEHGSPGYWRLNRAHINAAENVGVFAVVVLAAHFLGAGGPLIDQLAWATVALRVGQTLAHVSSNTVTAVNVRVTCFVLQLACIVAIGVLAFTRGAPEAAPTRAPAAEITCAASVQSTSRMKAFRGKADGPTRETALDAAWDDACKTLPASDVELCRDSKRYKGAEVIATKVKGEQKTFSASVTVREVAPVFEGEGKGPDKSQACQAAVTAACAAGGAGPACVESDAWELLEQHSAQ